jgi:hypothetical protein
LQPGGTNFFNSEDTYFFPFFLEYKIVSLAIKFPVLNSFIFLNFVFFTHTVDLQCSGTSGIKSIVGSPENKFFNFVVSLNLLIYSNNIFTTLYSENFAFFF